MTWDDLSEFPALADLPREVRSGRPDSEQVDAPEPEDDPAVEAIIPGEED